MLLSAVSVLVVAQSSSEIPEGLMNNSVYYHTRPYERQICILYSCLLKFLYIDQFYVIFIAHFLGFCFCKICGRRVTRGFDCGTSRAIFPLITKLNSVALVRERTIPTERPPPVGEVSANFCG